MSRRKQAKPQHLQAEEGATGTGLGDHGKCPVEEEGGRVETTFIGFTSAAVTETETTFIEGQASFQGSEAQRSCLGSEM